jgi:LAO/AO transport system kinase
MSSTPPVPARARASLTVADYAEGVLAWNRTMLARAITLIESNRPEHQAMAQELLNRLLPHTGRAIRVGLTGVPGAGKSAFIEALGCRLTPAGHRVAVLSIDPSSVHSGGSLLGDKTRMMRLSADPNAFIRPSPSGLVLGGVARKTRETMLVCEAAGCDVVLIETVGVGQSEVSVADMTDFLMVLMLGGAGDELQGIKRGLLEVADMIAVTKADGENLTRAKRAASKYAFAMRLLHGAAQPPPVVTCSSLDGTGIEEIWRTIVDRVREREHSGLLTKRRAAQTVKWMWSLADEQIRELLQQTEAVRSVVEEAERDVSNGKLSPVLGAQAIVRAMSLSAAEAARLPERGGSIPTEMKTSGVLPQPLDECNS